MPLQASKLQKQAEKLNKQLKTAHQTAAEAEVVHARAVAQHVKKLEDKEVSTHPMSGKSDLFVHSSCSISQPWCSLSSASLMYAQDRRLHSVLHIHFVMSSMAERKFVAEAAVEAAAVCHRQCDYILLTTCFCQHDMENQVDGIILSGRGQGNSTLLHCTVLHTHPLACKIKCNSCAHCQG